MGRQSALKEFDGDFFDLNEDFFTITWVREIGRKGILIIIFAYLTFLLFVAPII